MLRRLALILTLPLAAQSSGVELTYLGNCGFLATHGGKRIAFDLQGGSPDPGRIQGLTAVFSSHPHKDHFGAREHQDLLRANPQAPLVTGPEGAAAVVEAGLTARHLLVSPPPDAVMRRTIAGLSVEVLALHHAGAPAYRMQDLAFSVDLAGRHIFFLSDIDPAYPPNAQTLKAWSNHAKPIDVLLVVFDLLQKEEGMALVRQHLKPRNIVAMHLPASMVDQQSTLIRKHFPQTIFFRTPGETRSLQ